MTIQQLTDYIRRGQKYGTFQVYRNGKIKVKNGRRWRNYGCIEEMEAEMKLSTGPYTENPGPSTQLGRQNNGWVKGRYIGPEERLRGCLGLLRIEDNYVAALFWHPVAAYWHGPHYHSLSDFELETQ